MRVIILKNKREFYNTQRELDNKKKKEACSLRRRLNKIQRPACRKKSDCFHKKTPTVDINPETSLNILTLTNYKGFLLKPVQFFRHSVWMSLNNHWKMSTCIHSTFTTEQKHYSILQNANNCTKSGIIPENPGTPGKNLRFGMLVIASIFLAWFSY